MLLQIQEPESEERVSVIGIDFGTTHSVISIMGHQAFPLVPSLVAYDETGVCAVGEAASQLLKQSPERVVSSIKRLLGRGLRDERQGTFAHPIVETKRGLGVQVCGHTLLPIEIAAEIFKHLRELASKQLGYAVDQAVVTVPAYFDEAARAATRDAARLGGLSVLRLLNEPTAAALAYGLDQGVEGLYGVYDLGGGTFDFSLLKMEQGVFQVVATQGDLSLGGDDLDQLLAQSLLGEGFDRLDLAARKEVLQQIRTAKEHLSQQEEIEVALCGQRYVLERKSFEVLAQPLIQKTLDCVGQALDQAQVSPSDLEGIIFVGGSTRIPAIHRAVEAFFQKAPLTHLDPDQGVALGAGIQAQALTEGAQHLLLDVTPLSLGLETMGGLVERLLPRNTPIPASVTQTFTTFQDGQSAMKIHVLQGEHERMDACRSLGEFELRGIPPLAAGKARVRVTFTVDADGLLMVTALEEATGIAQSISVKPSYGLSEEAMQVLLETHQKDEREKTVFHAQQSLAEVRDILKTQSHRLSAAEIKILEDACTKIEETPETDCLSALEDFMATCVPIIQHTLA